MDDTFWLAIAHKNTDKLNKNQMFHLSYFNRRRYFDDDGSKKYLVFWPLCKTLRMPNGDTETVIAWKPKGLSDKCNKPRTTSNNILAPKLKWIQNSKISVDFKRICLKQDKVTFKMFLFLCGQ